MILTALILGAALFVGTSLVVTYWNSIVDWLKRCIRTVGQLIRMAVYGTKIFIRKLSEGLEEISRHYAKQEDGRWQETVVTREVAENEVPPEIRAMAQRGRETDVTRQLEMRLVS